MADQIPKTVRISIGTPAQGPGGFRDSHAQAQRGRRIIELSGRGAPVTSYAELALVDTMSGDLDLARAFVATELGALAVKGRREEEERRTLLAVLDAQGGLAAAAEELGVHRNTVLQRMRRAEERRGRPATDRVAELHAALRLVQVLGPVVLTSEPGRPDRMCCAHTGVGSAPLVGAARGSYVAGHVSNRTATRTRGLASRAS